MEFRCGGLLFTSKFDSGNLGRVEKVSKNLNVTSLIVVILGDVQLVKDGV